jgi:aspartate kinase
VSLIVQKYGGTSVGTVDRIKHVAARVAATRRQGHDVVVVVSAMAGQTNQLVDLAYQIANDPIGREYDVLLATGEQVSVALVALALKEAGVPARSMLAHQVRMLTDNAFSRARIQSVGANLVADTLAKGEVAVVAGFQGVDPEGNITTLGRGGSDTTAVAIAAAMKAQVCEIYTDVDGVYTADPHVVSKARKIHRISYEEMLELASLGAKVLQIRSVEFAMKYGVPVHVRSAFDDSEGSWLVPEESQMEQVVVRAVTSDRNEARVSILGVPDQPGVAHQVFAPLAEAGIVVDMIIQNASRDTGRTDLTFTVPKADTERAQAIVERLVGELGAKGQRTDRQVAKVSVVGVGMRSHTGVAAAMFRALAAHKINIQMISTSEIKISVVVQEQFVELAVRALHEAFGLDKS